MLLAFEEYKEINQLLEATNKTAIVSFGRMNPPTIGHMKLMKKLIELGKQHNAQPLLFLSHSQDKKKNPLTYEDKYKIVSQSVPTGLKVVKSEAKTVFDVLKSAQKLGATKIIMVAGSDRVTEFERFGKYKDEIGITEYKVVSAGERDPDSEGVEGMSATKMRQLAKDGKYEEFKRGSVCNNNEQLAKYLYDKTREGLEIKS